MTIPNMSDPVVSEIVQARVNLLFNAPFFGNLATRLTLQEVKWTKTVASDGHHFFYNREYIKQLSRPQLIFVLGHCVLHAIFDHIGRRNNREREIWDLATDFIVNSTLKKENVGEAPSGTAFSDKYTDELSSEEVYNLLKKNGIPNQYLNSKGSGTGGRFDDHLDYDGTDGEECPSCKGSGCAECDDTGRVNPWGPGGKNPNGNPDSGKETGVDYSKKPPTYTESELNVIANDIKAAVINAYQSNQGNAPGIVERLLDELCSPKINWKELLTAKLQSTIKDDYTFMKFSKKTWATGGQCLLPGNNLETSVNVAVSLDTSGSIGDKEFAAFLSETVGIVEQFGGFTLHLWCIDASIYKYVVITDENKDDIENYKPYGGGGNDFPLNWTHMRENDINPDVFVCFSDGYPCGSWGDEDSPFDVIFVILNEWDKNIVAPFGTTVYMDDLENYDKA